FQPGTAGRRLGGDDCLLDSGGRQRGPVPAWALEAETRIITAMRPLRLLLVLVFGLAMVGPETHACPIHDQGPTHHQHSSSQHQRAHCTCPQACCPAGVSVSIPTPTASWTADPLPVVLVDVAASW